MKRRQQREKKYQKGKGILRVPHLQCLLVYNIYPQRVKKGEKTSYVRIKLCLKINDIMSKEENRISEITCQLERCAKA